MNNSIPLPGHISVFITHLLEESMISFIFGALWKKKPCCVPPCAGFWVDLQGGNVSRCVIVVLHHDTIFSIMKTIIKRLSKFLRILA